MTKPSKNMCISNLLQNIISDRAAANLLLADAIQIILTTAPSGKEDVYRNIGPAAAKYLEVLQKINDQLVKAVQLLDKKKPEEDDEEEVISENLESKIAIFGKKAMGSLYEILEKKN